MLFHRELLEAELGPEGRYEQIAAAMAATSRIDLALANLVDKENVQVRRVSALCRVKKYRFVCLSAVRLGVRDSVYAMLCMSLRAHTHLQVNNLPLIYTNTHTGYTQSFKV